MIPSPRLIGVSCLLPLLGIVPALAPRFNALAGLTALSLAVFAILDLVRSRTSLAGVVLTVPPLIRMTAGRPAEIPLRCTATASQPPPLTIALGLPASFRDEQESLTIAALAPDTYCLPGWKTQPGRRGRFFLSRVALAGPSGLGLWEIRVSRPLATEIRVYPDLLRDQHQLAVLFLPQSRAGVRVRRQTGQGREFEKLRDFIPGDSLDRIHWKATAKRNKPMSKEYQVERTQEVYLVIDASRLASMALEPGQEGGPASLFELYLKTTLLTGLAAQQQNDLFGLCVFSSRIKGFLRAKGGKNHFNACCEQLLTLEPDPVSPDYRELVTFLGRQLRKRALLIILTNLDDPVAAEEFSAGMELLNRRHLVVAVTVNSTSVRPLFSDGKVSSLDDIYQDLAGHLQDERLRTLEQQLRRHGVQLLRPAPDTLPLRVINQYLAIKERQQL